MTVAELTAVLQAQPTARLHIALPDGDFVPGHFHVTEVGRVQKDFIDCGGTTRSLTTCLLQLWVANDTEHRLLAGKLAGILHMASPLLQSGELPVELEYDTGTATVVVLGGWELAPAGLILNTVAKHTDCLAKDKCGVGTDCC